MELCCRIAARLAGGGYARGGVEAWNRLCAVRGVASPISCESPPKNLTIRLRASSNSMITENQCAWRDNCRELAGVNSHCTCAVGPAGKDRRSCARPVLPLPLSILGGAPPSLSARPGPVVAGCQVQEVGALHGIGVFGVTAGRRAAAQDKTAFKRLHLRGEARLLPGSPAQVVEEVAARSPNPAGAADPGSSRPGGGLPREGVSEDPFQLSDTAFQAPSAKKPYICCVSRRQRMNPPSNGVYAAQVMLEAPLAQPRPAATCICARLPAASTLQVTACPAGVGSGFLAAIAGLARMRRRRRTARTPG